MSPSASRGAGALQAILTGNPGLNPFFIAAPVKSTETRVTTQMRAILIAPQLDNVFKTPDAGSQEHFEPRFQRQDLVARIGQNAAFDLRKIEIITAYIQAAEMRLHAFPGRHRPARPVEMHNRPEARHNLQAGKKRQRHHQNFYKKLAPQR